MIGAFEILAHLWGIGNVICLYVNVVGLGNSFCFGE